MGYVDLGSAISASFSEPLVKIGEANFYRFPVPSREVSRFFITCIHHFPEHPPYSTLVGPRGDGNCGELVLVIRSIYSLVHDHQNFRHRTSSLFAFRPSSFSTRVPCGGCLRLLL